jgi:hypothetical protein
MARYYFHICDQETFIPDEEGLELSGIAAALAEAALTVNDLILANLRCGRVISTSVEIADGSGAMLDIVAVNRVIH